MLLDSINIVKSQMTMCPHVHTHNNSNKTTTIKDQLAKTTLNKTNAGGLTTPDFKLYCSTLEINHHGIGYK